MNMPREKTHLQKAMDSLYEALKEQQTNDKELRDKIQQAINKTNSALELARQRDRGKSAAPGSEEEDYWLG